MALHSGSMISVTNATHVSASVTGLGRLESSFLFEMLTTHFCDLITAVMLRMHLCIADIQKQRGGPVFSASYHSTVVRYITTFLQS
jgi:hypothetical protein